jgi:hypothetical protein
MVALYQSGCTLQAIGDQFTISRERVRQVLLHAGYDMAALRADASRARRGRIVDECGPQIELLLSSGREPREVASVLGVPADLVQGIDSLHPRYRVRRRSLRVNPQAKYTGDEVLECLRLANSAIGGVMTTAEYAAEAAGRVLSDGRPWPGPQTAMLRFGTWRSAMTAAGLPSNASHWRQDRRLFDSAHCIDAILEVERVVGRIPTVRDYNEYAKRMDGALPSLSTIRHRLGTWATAVQQALDFESRH